MNKYAIVASLRERYHRSIGKIEALSRSFARDVIYEQKIKIQIQYMSRGCFLSLEVFSLPRLCFYEESEKGSSYKRERVSGSNPGSSSSIARPYSYCKKLKLFVEGQRILHL